MSRFGCNFLSETVHGSGLVEVASENGGCQVAPAMQSLAVTGDMERRVVRKRKVSEEKPPGMQSGNDIQGGVPEFDGNVGRRSGRKNEGMAVDGNPRGITDEGDSFGLVKIGNVMMGVAGGIKNLETTRRKLEEFTALQGIKIGGRDGQEIAK